MTVPGKGGKPAWPYDPELGSEICRLLVEGKDGGPMSLSAISRKKGFPSLSVIFKWLHDSKEFEDNYSRAREMQADANADQIQHIADTEKDLDRARIRIDARKWYAGRMKPKVYGVPGNSTNINATGNVSVTITEADEKAM